MLAESQCKQLATVRVIQVIQT